MRPPCACKPGLLVTTTNTYAVMPIYKTQISFTDQRKQQNTVYNIHIYLKRRGNVLDTVHIVKPKLKKGFSKIGFLRVKSVLGQI